MDVVQVALIAKVFDHSHPSPFEIIKRITCFSWFESYVLKHNQDIYIFFSYKILTAIITLFFSNYFQSSFSDGKFITFHLDLFIIDLYLSINFCYSFRMFSCFCMNCNILNTFIIFFIDGIYCCFFVFYPLRRIYILFSTVRIYFMTSMIQQMNTIKKKNSLPFIGFKLFWYLFLNKSKSFVITLFVSSLIMVSMLSLFESSTRSSSLSIEGIKLIAIIS